MTGSTLTQLNAQIQLFLTKGEFQVGLPCVITDLFKSLSQLIVRSSRRGMYLFLEEILIPSLQF